MLGWITLIGVLVGIPFVYFTFLPRKTEHQRETISWILFFVMFVFVCLFIGISAYIISSWRSGQQIVDREHYNLHSMTGDQQLSGSFRGFFLFQSGKLDEELTYNYWYEVSINGWKHSQLTDGDNVIVYEDATPQTAYLVKLQVQEICGQQPQWAEWSLIGCGSRDKGEPWWEFHVPPGTIHNDFGTK